jgi:thiamine biosynthesis protein ThiS
MTLLVSGAKKDFNEDITVSALIEIEKVETPEYVSVSVNGEFVKSADFSSFTLKDGDDVEFLYFMGGGAMTNEQMTRYSRHIILKEIGVKGQKKLLDASVLIIGAGGLGAPAALYLSAAGVGKIGIADADDVDLSNLQRQVIHATPDIGKPKTQSAKESMEAINPEIEVNAYREFVRAENILGLISEYDFIIDGTDNFPAKFLINDACVIAKKAFSHAGIIRFKGQLMTYVPGRGPCYRCVFKTPPPPDAVPTCRQAGVIGAMGGVIGSLQAMEAVKYITGVGELLTGSLLTYDALKMEFRKIKLPSERDCAVCGEHPTILSPVDYEQPVCEVKRDDVTH